MAEAIPVSQIADDLIQMVLYGPNRVGKTTLACQFPKPLLLVAMEPNRTGGARSVKRVPGVTYLRIDSTTKAVKLAKELQSGLGNFKTVVLDSATAYQDIALKELMGWEEIPSTSAAWGTVKDGVYQQRSEKCKEMLREFLKIDSHVIIIAKEKDHNPPENRKNRGLGKLTGESDMQLGSFFAASLGMATVDWLHDSCDYICRYSIDKEVVLRKVKVGDDEMEMPEETGKKVRRLRCILDTHFAGGFRSCTPEAVPEFILDPTWDKIRRVINGEKLEQ